MTDFTGAECTKAELVSYTYKIIVVDAASMPSLGEKVLYGEKEFEVSERSLRTIPGKCVLGIYGNYRREAA